MQEAIEKRETLLAEERKINHAIKVMQSDTIPSCAGVTMAIGQYRRRLREITEAVLTHPDKSIRSIMGSGVDAWKFKACMTLFDTISPNDIFAQALVTFYNGERDNRTLKRISG
jgi:uncharacterized protein (DUF1810 family)